MWEKLQINNRPIIGGILDYNINVKNTVKGWEETVL
jgi:hypothetical protein